MTMGILGDYICRVAQDKSVLKALVWVPRDRSQGSQSTLRLLYL
ncbi:MAG: hypothetical protein AAFU71_19760 [Cyanobacteria bacterium J06632_22]